MTVAIVSGVCDGFKEVIDSTKELFQNETFQEVITGISIAGIAVGVPLMILVRRIISNQHNRSSNCPDTALSSVDDATASPPSSALNLNNYSS